MLGSRLAQQQKAYRDLEEEFRTALRIEAARYNQVHVGIFWRNILAAVFPAAAMAKWLRHWT